MFCWISSLLIVLQTLLLIMGDGENYDKVEEQTYSSRRLQEAKNEQSGEWHFVYDKDGQLTEKYKGSGKWWDSKRERWRYEWNQNGTLKAVKSQKQRQKL